MTTKKSLYFLVPIIALIAFAAYDWSYVSKFEERETARKAAIRRAHDEKIAEDNRLRLQAVQEAIASEAKRKAERAAKAAQAAKEQQELDAAREARDLANIDVAKLRDKYNNLVRETREAQDEIKKIQADKQVQASDLDFLQIETSQAKTHVESLTTVLTQITAADAAFTAAAAARAAVAAGKK